MDSNDVGVILLSASAVPLISASVLAVIGLTQLKSTVANAVAVTTSMLAAQPGLAVVSPEAGAAVDAQLNAVGDTLGTVNDALQELKGPLAPARAMLALALLLIVSSLISFGLVDVSVADGAGDTSVVQDTGGDGGEN